MSLRSLALVIAHLGAGWLVGCGGVRMQPVHSSVQRPSNVAVYVAVEDGGEPVSGLTANNFRVEEDGVLLEQKEARVTLLDRNQVALHHTVVLVDLSGEVDERSRETTSRGVAHLVEKLRPTQGVTVLGFDGSPRLHQLAEFSRSESANGKPELGALLRFRSRDQSRNLNGAVLEGLKQLDARLMRAGKPVRLGTLVVFTEGDDLAGRVSPEDLRKALDETPHRLYALGIEGRETHQLTEIGRHGVERSQSSSSLSVAFEELAMRLKKAWGQYYLVQYCSPARDGVRQVRFRVEYENAEGKSASGDMDLEFDATGFSGGCDPKARPRFVTALSQPGEIEARRSEAAAKKSRSPAGTSAGDSSTEQKDASGGDSPPPAGSEAIVAPPSSGDYAE